MLSVLAWVLVHTLILTAGVATVVALKPDHAR